MERVRARIAVVGDIHLSWNEQDIAYFNQSSYDMILFVGDLPGRGHRGLLQVASALAKVRLPALFIPGNHDGVANSQFLGELMQQKYIIESQSRHQDRLCAELVRALAPVRSTCYERHLYSIRGSTFEIISARPHSMGGPNVAYYPYLRRKYGIENMRDSTSRLKSLVDQSNCRNIIFLAHNGPTGLSYKRDDIWGCDFRRAEGDHGDPDLRAAIDYARIKERRVLAVVAGHMHDHLRGGGKRKRFAREQGTAMINTARVPRIFKEGGEVKRHHVCLEITSERAIAWEVLVSLSGEERQLMK